MITQITSHIFIGELCDLLDNPVEDLKKLGITHVISILAKDDERLQKKFRDAWRRTILVRRTFIEVSANDDDVKELHTQLNMAYYKLDSIFFADYREKVLIHCVAGMDRSPFVVAKYLLNDVKSIWEEPSMDTKDLVIFRTMEDAYTFIKKKRPMIREHYEWMFDRARGIP